VNDRAGMVAPRDAGPGQSVSRQKDEASICRSGSEQLDGELVLRPAAVLERLVDLSGARLLGPCLPPWRIVRNPSRGCGTRFGLIPPLGSWLSSPSCSIEAGRPLPGMATRLSRKNTTSVRSASDRNRHELPSIATAGRARRLSSCAGPSRRPATRSITE